MLGIYTEVAAFMGWINETILSMGGMQACGLTLEATPTQPTEGWFQVKRLFMQLNVDTGDKIMMVMMVMRIIIITVNLQVLPPRLPQSRRRLSPS